MASEATARRAFPPSGTSRLSANERNPRNRAPFPRNSPHMGTAPKGAVVGALKRSTKRSRVNRTHPAEFGHL